MLGRVDVEAELAKLEDEEKSDNDAKELRNSSMAQQKESPLPSTVDVSGMSHILATDRPNIMVYMYFKAVCSC